MKIAPVLFAALAFPLAASAANAPVAATRAYSVSGTLLSTNLSAAIVRLNKDVSVSSGGLFGGGASGAGGGLRAADGPCIGGVCGTPVGGGGCTTSPENPTALLALIGGFGLIAGRIVRGRLTARREATAAA